MFLKYIFVQNKIFLILFLHLMYQKYMQRLHLLNFAVIVLKRILRYAFNRKSVSTEEHNLFIFDLLVTPIRKVQTNE